MSDDRIDVKIGAQLAGLTAGLAESKAQIRSAVSDMKSHFSSLTSAAEAIKSPFIAIAGIVAGGAIFKGVISSTMEWTSGVIQLSKRLGITTEEASGLKVALDHLGIGTDEYSTMVGKVTRTMRTNEQAFTSLGIKTHESNGEWRNSQEIMGDVVDRLSHMKAGTDRNVAAQAIFGARIGDLTKFLRMNKEMMEESAEKAKKFNLIVGGDGEAKLRAYQNALADIHLIGESLKVQIGNALIPVLTQLGDWLGNHGAEMAEFFKAAITKCAIVLRQFAGDIKTLMISWQGFVMQIKLGDAALGESFSKLIHGDFVGAKNVLVQGWRDVRVVGDETARHMKEAAANTKTAIDALRNPKAAPKSKKSDGTTTDGGDPGKDPLAAKKKEWELAQAQFKLQEAQVADSEDAIIGIKLAAQAKALAIFGEYSTEYLAASTDLQNALNKENADAEKIRLDVQKKAREESQRDWESLFSGIANGIQSSVLGVIQGTQTMAAAIKNLLRSITLEYISLGVKTLIAHKATELAKTGATAQGTAQRLALEYWAAVKSVAIGAWSAIARIGQYAIEGAAAAFKSIAAIPIFGPALAPAVAAAAGLAIAGFAGRIASAKGGYDIPAGISPITQLHSSEMVLPASLADRIRGMTDTAGSGGTVHFHVNAIDGQSVKRFFDQHGDHIVRVIKGKQRDFAFDT